MANARLYARRQAIVAMSTLVKIEAVVGRSKTVAAMLKPFSSVSVHDGGIAEVTLAGRNLRVLDLSLLQGRMRFRIDSIVAMSADAVNLDKEMNKRQDGYITFNKRLITGSAKIERKSYIVVLSTYEQLTEKTLSIGESIKTSQVNIKGTSVGMVPDVTTSDLTVLSGPGTVLLAKDEGMDYMKSYFRLADINLIMTLVFIWFIFWAYLLVILRFDD